MSWDDMLPNDVASSDSEGDDFFDPFSEGLEENSEKLGSSTMEKVRTMKKLTAGRIVLMVLVGIVVSFLIFVVVGSVYTNKIRYPAKEEIIVENTGRYALESFNRSVKELNTGIEGAYLDREYSYANANSDRQAFMKYVAGTVLYTPDIVNAKNVFGNDLVDPETDEIVTETSWVSLGEEVTLSYVDYSAIEFDADKVKDMVKSSGLTVSDVSYQDRVTDLFCEYIYSIPVEEVPVKSVRRVPALIAEGNGYVVGIDEDVYLDKLLFSSNELYDCFERFAEVAGKAANGGKSLSKSDEYVAWTKLSEAKKTYPAPLMYGKYSIGRLWLGAYYLSNEYVYDNNHGGVSPQLGDGSFEQPASVGTPVVTYVLRGGGEESLRKYPIRVTMIEFGVSQDAIDYFQSKDVQNRGYDVTSEVQYCYYVFEITNLSNETLDIYDNASLCDSSANVSNRTGMIYGLQDHVVLAPEETGYIETWGRSTELNLKYVIWGADFARRESPVWFRVLAGDLEDPTWEKGVYINSSRDD